MTRVELLRSLIAEHGCDAYLITDSDAHYTFYSLSRIDRRINWITECQAQCGLAIVTLHKGAVFQVPPNYRLLAKAEMNESIWTVVDDLFVWLGAQTPELVTIGYDPRLTPFFVMQQFTNKCQLRPVPLSVNLIDAISYDETSLHRQTLTPIWSLDEHRFAGQTSREKIDKLRQSYLTDGQKRYTLVVTAMDEIAWLLNLRGNDMECNPLLYSFLIVSLDHLILFTDNPHQVSPTFHFSS